MRGSTIDGMLRGTPQRPSDRTRLDVAVARASVMAGLFGRPEELVGIGRYRLRHALGEGAHGQVFAAWDPELDRSVAVKLVRDTGADAERFRERTAREARALARLSHPNVVEVYDVGVHDDSVFVVMELVDGEDLGRTIARTRPDLAELLALFVAAGRGLAAAHAVGLVHRDFKPTNVLVGDGKVKVADFGLAHGEVERTGEDTPTATLPGAGTPIYMAPEQHVGATVDARADQYAFCVALWEAIAGQPPFVGARASALLEAKLAGVGDRRPAGASRALAAVLRRGLAADPGRRFRSMDALLDALERGASTRTRVIAVGVAALAVAGLGMLAAAGGTRVAACEEQRAAPWNPALRTAVHDGLTGSGSVAQAERVVELLDAWSVRWADARNGACAGRDAARTGAALRCLGAAAAELEALTGALRDADADVADRATFAARGLPDPEGCLDPSAEMLARPSTPEHEAVERRVARARSLRRAARLDDALAEAKRAVADAEALDADARVAALGELGFAHEAFERWDAAEDAHRAAYFLAEAEGMAWSSATAAIRLARVQLGRRDREASEVWLRHAEAALQRAGFPRTQHIAYLSALGVHRIEGARWSEARAAFDEVLALADEDDAEGRAAAAFNRAWIEQQVGDLEAAERYIVDAIALQEEAYGPDHPEVARMMWQLGNFQFLDGRYAEARATVERARELALEAYPPDAPPMAHYEESLGMIAHESDDPDAALAHHGRALAIRQATLPAEHPDIALSLMHVAMVELERGQLDAAIPRLEETARVLEAAFGDEHPNVAYPLTILGSAYAEAGRLDEGIAMLRRADAIRTATEAPPDLLGETLRHLAVALALAGAPATEVDATAERARASFRAAGERFEERVAMMDGALAVARGEAR